MTNAGNRPREKMTAMIQQDLQVLGIRLNVVTLDFRSLIERMTQSFQYEACLLGLTKSPPPPERADERLAQFRQRSPVESQPKTPATEWEAEIDKLMRAQAAEPRIEQRKRLFDRVQQIVLEQAPFLYLVTKNSLMAFSPQLRNTAPASIQPQAYWNIDTLQKSTLMAKGQ